MEKKKKRRRMKGLQCMKLAGWVGNIRIEEKKEGRSKMND